MRIITNQEAHWIDSWAETKSLLPTAILMENAGSAIAEVISEALKERFKEKHQTKEIIILAGFGNNGADGLVAARHLDEMGYEVRIITPEPTGHTSELFDKQSAIIERLDIPMMSINDSEDSLEGAAVIVDALIGTSLQGELRPAMLTVLDAVESYLDIYEDILVISVDLPSGVNGNDGSVSNGTLGVDMTVTFGTAKQGMYLYPAREYCGDIIVKGLGFNWELALLDEDNHIFPTELVTDSLAASLVPEREATAHKGTNGHVLIIGGAAGMIGAPVLASEGAFRSGAGKVSTVVPSDCLESLQSKIRPEILTGSFSNLIHLRMHNEGKDAVVIGPGLGRNEEISTLAKNFMTHTEIPMVIDADGLWALGNVVTMDEILKSKEIPAVLTPHPGEFSRLSGKSVKEIEADRISIARDFAIAHNVVLVLKGAPTVIASPDGFVAVNASGNEGMGSGGMGDTLAGIIGAFLAQGLEAVEAAMLGVYIHGAGADSLQEQRPWGFTATEVAEQVPYELMKLINLE